MRSGGSSRKEQLTERLEDILRRLTTLESAGHTSISCSGQEQHVGHLQGEDAMGAGDPLATQQRLSQELTAKGIAPFAFKRMPHDYYQQDLEYRRGCLGADSIAHLCKSIVMENTKLSEEEAEDTPKYVCVIVQYVARLHGEKLKRALHKEHKARGGGLPIKSFNMRLVPEDVSDRLTGFQHNAVTPVGSASPHMPIVLSHRITELQPPEAFMWLGGGEPDLKLGFRVGDFVRAYQPTILDCTYD